MNRIYSILAKGLDLNSEFYQRKVDVTVGVSLKRDIGELLVPETGDASYRNYMAEQLVQICLKSRLKTTLSAIDTFNTYEHGFDLIDPLTSIGSLPVNVEIDLLEPDMRHTWLYQSIPLSVNPTGLAFINGLPQDFTMTDSLSSVITLADGLDIKLRGQLPVSTFSTTITARRQPHRAVEPLISILKKVKTTWLPQYEEYRFSRDVNDWLAAFVLNYCEVVDGS